ncbi:ABC transporter permease [Fructilactobacillus sanfranciscensis]|nr:ABC transporter permease [Fructilactobacillus sanfranciscensis]MCG7195608.1 ABC transporter permease [Fructilactobacillus sanfranciscensis]NDR97212.1 ABC transporter permease [Fructilactobacillus sanfranciscensis]
MKFILLWQKRMIIMNNFFKHRLGLHFKEMTRYLKYVFNDFFVIALMFFIGALGLVYSNFLKEVVGGLWWEKVVIILVLVIALQICGMATLIKQPDKVFIAPKEYEFGSYLKSSFYYSLTLAFLFEALVVFILMPFVSISLHWNGIQIIELFCLILILKWLILKNNWANFYLDFPKSIFEKVIVNLIIPAIVLIVTLYVNLSVGIALALFFSILLQLALNRLANLLDWKYLIDNEERRMANIYRFFSLFQDVPEVKPKVKRRRWASPLLKSVKTIHNNTFTKLYLLTFIRDGEISSLYFRLIIIGFLVIVFVKNNVLSLCIYDLFIYLVGFQLIPFYKIFDDNVFVHIYPISEKTRMYNFRIVVRTMLSIEILVLTIGMLISGTSIQFIGFALIVGLFEIYCLTGPYLKSKFEN